MFHFSSVSYSSCFEFSIISFEWERGPILEIVNNAIRNCANGAIMAVSSKPQFRPSIFKMEDDTNVEVKSFKDYGVCDALCQTIAGLGWKKPSPIQAECLKYAFEDRDIIGLAETGSGKTGAFAVPMIQRLIDNPQRLFGLVLTPTRELAFQISEQFEALGASVGLKTAVIVGGVDMVQQALALARKPHVIIATPGRLVDHLENTKVGTVTVG